MKATQISIVDQEHFGDQYASPAPFEIEASVTTMANWPNAPVTVKVCEGTTPERAAYLLRQIADALERNGRQWLPCIDGTEHNAAQSILESLGHYGSLAGVVQYDYSEPDADGHCFARLNKLHTLRSDHNPSVRVEILSGTDPTEAVSLLAGILKFVKKQAKQPGAFVVAAPVQTDNFDEVPF